MIVQIATFSRQAYKSEGLSVKKLGSLTSYLQREFERQAPLGWNSAAEVSLLPKDVEILLGYASRADVVLQQQNSER